MQVISNYASAIFSLPVCFRVNAGGGAFAIDRNNTKMDASRASLHPAYPIHLYGLSLINSFLTRLPALVPLRSHDKTSLTSSTICSAASARRATATQLLLKSKLSCEPSQPETPLHDQWHAANDAPETPNASYIRQSLRSTSSTSSLP